MSTNPTTVTTTSTEQPQQQTATGPQQPQQNPTTTTDNATLSPAGEQALEAFKRRAREAEARLHEQNAELEKMRDAQRTESEKAIEKARKEAAEGARKDVLASANRRIVLAEIRAAAGGKLADPGDAVRLLNVEDFTVNEDGEVDAKAITKAIDGLLDAKPYLSANAKRVQGTADGGARPVVDDAAISPGLGRLTQAYSQTKK